MPVANQVYLDTSALVKRYVPEPNSDRFDTYFANLESIVISRLTYVEVRSMLAKKRREKRLNPDQECAAMREFNMDIRLNAIHIRPMTETDFIDAYHLIDELPELPLRTLDALHLCVARTMEVSEIATADDVMRRVGEKLGLKIAYFGTYFGNSI
jgi:predicted nucleic acid-binding protein